MNHVLVTARRDVLIDSLSTRIFTISQNKNMLEYRIIEAYLCCEYKLEISCTASVSPVRRLAERLQGKSRKLIIHNSEHSNITEIARRR